GRIGRAPGPPERVGADLRHRQGPRRQDPDRRSGGRLAAPPGTAAGGGARLAGPGDSLLPAYPLHPTTCWSTLQRPVEPPSDPPPDLSQPSKEGSHAERHSG